jgi:hypothetical protein
MFALVALAVTLGSLLFLLVITTSAASAATIQAADVSTAGALGNSSADFSSISADGRYVSFRSQASNLVPGDQIGQPDIFLRDLVAGTTVRISVGYDGSEALGYSYDSCVSADGRYVVFESFAFNIVPDDTNNDVDVFLWDRQTGENELIDVSSSGVQGNTRAGGASVSADGRYVAFYSTATNLVDNDTNGVADIFIRDRQAGTTSRVTLGTGGAQADGNTYYPSISSDGRYLVFASEATNLVPGDTNGYEDVFVRDLVAGTTTRVSMDVSGAQRTTASSRPSISADGRYVAYAAFVPGSSGGHVFVRDTVAGVTTQMDLTPSGGQPVNTSSFAPSISPDGRYVAFQAQTKDLVPHDTAGYQKIFVRDRVAGTTRRASESSLGDAPNYPCYDPSVCTGGRVVFNSIATNLLTGISGPPWGNIFVSDPSPAPTITSLSPNKGPGTGGNTVVITGTNFVGLFWADSVMFGSNSATSFHVDSSTQITAVAPSYPDGTCRVKVRALGEETADTPADDYTFQSPPAVTSLTLATGPAAGGTTVVIHGVRFVNLSGPEAVAFGGTAASSYAVDSDTQITAVSPPHVPGRVAVKVTNPVGSSLDSVGDGFTYLPAPSTPEAFSPTRLTTNSYHDEMPEVSGDRIVWAAVPDGTDYEIFTWTPSTGVRRLTTNNYDDRYPVVSGDRIAWLRTGGSDGGTDDEVCTWTPAGGTVQLTRNNLEDGWVNISGDRIVWMEAQTTAGDNTEVFTWTASGATQRVTNNSYEDYYPEVSGNRIAWVNNSTPNGKALTWTPSGGTAEVYSGDRSIDYATVSGDRIACVSAPDRIYVWTPSGSSWVDAGIIGYDLRIDGERIAWDADVRGVNQVFTWTAGEGATQVSNGTADQFLERVSGDRVVWLDYGTATIDAEVHCWTPARGSVQVTSDSVEQWAPTVSGNRLVWMGENATGTTEIYTAVAGPVLSPFEDTDPHIAYAPTASWVSFPSASSSGGAYMRANTLGSSATVYFNGTQLDWIAMKGTTTGKADVYLDDEFQTTVDLSAASAAYKVNVWSSGTLESGVHKFTIAWNTGNTAGKYITLDRVDVAGSLIYGPPAITSLSPASGSPAGGTIVTISGSGFSGLSGASAVQFGGQNAQSYTVNSPTKITATAPAHGVGSVRVQVTTPSGTTPDTAADDFTYAETPPTTRTEAPAASSGGFTYSGTWTAFASASASGGSYTRSATTGAYVLICFKGTQLDWITLKGTTGAKADIYVDGSLVKAATVDLYASPAVYQQNVWSTGVLPDGYHTVKIVRSAASVTGRYLTVDAVEVAGNLTAPLHAEETDAHLTFSPVMTSWTLGSTTSASGGTYRYINTSGAYLSFSFTGVGFKLTCKTAPSYGNLTVTIDGVAQTVSLYSSVTTYKKVVLTKFLTPGPHTVKIARAGTKSTSSTGYTIDLDAIDLFGEWS